MIRLKTIKKLYIDKAEYVVANLDGKQARVEIDYTQGKYQIFGNIQKDFLKDLHFFAKDLIERKSKVNFA